MKQTKWIQTIALFAALSHALYAQDQTPKHRIVISIPDKTLTLFEGDEVKKVYDVAVGKPSTPSPVGVFEVVNHIDHPTWYGHGKPVPPGEHNPLGTRWMGLSKKGYGIHGTNEPDSIGKAVSHGCIRMHNEDVEELFEQVEVGVTVELVDF